MSRYPRPFHLDVIPPRLPPVQCYVIADAVLGGGESREFDIYKILGFLSRDLYDSIENTRSTTFLLVCSTSIEGLLNLFGWTACVLFPFNETHNKLCLGCANYLITAA